MKGLNMKRYAIRITEETLTLIAKLHEGRIIDLDSHKDDYFLAYHNRIAPGYNYVMNQHEFFGYWPEADKTALLQTVR